MRHTALAAIAVCLLFPLVWTLLAAFGITPDNSSQPPVWAGPPTLEKFTEVGVSEPAFWTELITSTAIALCATGVTIAASFLAAYALARTPFSGRRVTVQSFLVLASLPAMAYVIPLSDAMRRVHLLDTFAGVMLSEAAATAPLAVFVLYGVIAQLPIEGEEAAVIDGASLFAVLGRVVVPAVAPGIAATAIVVFVLDWNTLLVPLVLTGGEVRTVPVAMSDFFTFERELEWPVAAAALMVSLAPLALIVAVFSRAVTSFRLQADPG